ncbi:serine hydrolase FSH [Scheffersomyces coipomensis]|uniref:serine hydrolase FSH n=1 Tax=Scheffersomyces coipomensis TaxID=1788519 RepID=UPI00315DCA7C
MMTSSTSIKRVLCLPGFLQSGRVLAEKSSGLRKILTKKYGFELDYISPPNIIPNKEQLPFKLGQTEEEENDKWNYIVENETNRSWWDHQDPGLYLGFDEAIQYIGKYIKENGPYDAIIGFSQGAAMAAITTNCIQEIVPGHPPFEVALLISGFAFTILKENNTRENRWNVNYEVEDLEEYKQKVEIQKDYLKYFQPPSDMNTKIISVYGKLDNTVPPIRSKFLSSIYKEANLVSFEHEGAHLVPNKKTFLEPIVTLFRESLQPKSSL